MINTTRYLFFTGGFDSGAILLNYFFNRDYQITPIYIRDAWADNGGVGKSQRRSHRYELDSIKAIMQNLKQDFPHHQHKLNNVKIIEKVRYSRENQQYADEIFQHGLSHRRINQFASMAQVCEDLNIQGDTGVLYDETFYRTRLKDMALGFGTDNCRLNLATCQPFMQLYKNLRFPIAHSTKLDLLSLAKKNGWSNYLNLSWSCWFPNAKGEPCGQCNMCKQRIIPHRKASQLDLKSSLPDKNAANVKKQ